MVSSYQPIQPVFHSQAHGSHDHWSLKIKSKMSMVSNNLHSNPKQPCFRCFLGPVRYKPLISPRFTSCLRFSDCWFVTVSTPYHSKSTLIPLLIFINVYEHKFSCNKLTCLSCCLCLMLTNCKSNSTVINATLHRFLRPFNLEWKDMYRKFNDTFG